MAELVPHSESPLRFRSLMRLNKELVVDSIQVNGKENIALLPEGRTPVIAVTHHISDVDVQTAATVLDQSFDLGVALQSTNRQNPFINAVMTFAGQENFFDVDFREENGIKKYAFNKENFEAMKEAMKDGKTPLIAAHTPVYDRELPDMPGFGVVYLAQLSGDRLILPVTVQIHSTDNVGRITDIATSAKKLAELNRPQATVSIGTPLELDEVSEGNLEDMTKMIEGITTHVRSGLSDTAYQRAKNTYRTLREQGSAVMTALAENLPKSMRGNHEAAPYRKEKLPRSSKIFEAAVKANTKVITKVNEVIGKENVRKLPEGSNPVIAVSHLGSDVSLQAAASVLADSFKLSFAAHGTSGVDKAFRFFIRHALDMKLYGVNATLKKKQGIERYTFDPADYTPMVEAMNNNETIMTAGHYPTTDGTLPSYGGISSVYLAHKSGERVVLPVLVDFHTNEQVGRIDHLQDTMKMIFNGEQPRSSVVIGEPFVFDPIPYQDLQLFEQYYTKDNAVSLSEQKIQRARAVHTRLKEDAARVMEFYASHLPEERRGRWGRNIPTIE